MTGLTKIMIHLVATLFLTVALTGCQSESKTEIGKVDSAALAEMVAQDSLRIELVGMNLTTALDLLKAHHDVDYRNTAVGAFVTRIELTESGSEYFWIYSVNDSMPNTACDKYVTSDGDRVVWHYRRMRR